MNMKGKVVTELDDAKRLLDLALLCDISQYLNDLNSKLQGQEELISVIFGAVRTVPS
jgi:hypothetical protein